MTLLLDITDLPAQYANSGLDLMHKAMAEGADGFVPHENPYLTQLVEVFHQRGVTQLDAMWGELLDILHGRHPFDPNAAHGRLTQAELSLLEQLLKMGDPDQYTVNDWMLLVDYWLERYLPPTFAVTQATWLTTRAVFMGRLQAVMAKPADIDQALSLAPAQPMTAPIAKVIEFGQAHATESIVSLGDAAKHKVKNAIINHLEEQSLAGKQFTTGLEGLQSKLFDQFGDMNKDWRRIAITETGEMANQAFVAGQPPGAKLKRIEMYRDACPFCTKINGLIVTVVPPDQRFKNPWTHVWVGKTNIGRSSSPMKKVGDKLVPRSPDEMWWPAAGLQHPNCRGSWVPELVVQPGDDPEFHDYLKNLWQSADSQPTTETEDAAVL
jgi:hypothetical protein